MDDAFVDFLTAPPTRGVGASVPLIRRIVADDPEALDLLDRALQRPASIHAGDNVNGSERPDGNARATALRRLRKDRPDLHAEVLAGNLTAHAAMRAAGYRPRTTTVRVDSATSMREDATGTLSPA